MSRAFGESANSPSAKEISMRLMGWSERRRSAAFELLEVALAIGAVTLLGEFFKLTYHTLGLIYLLAVIMLSLRVGRWPVLVAGLGSAATWLFIFMPPRFSFAVLRSDDGLLLGAYLVVALVAGELTSRVREQEQLERLRERRATALFNLIRAIAEANSFDEAVRASLQQIDALFEAGTAILLPTMEGDLRLQATRSCDLTPAEHSAAAWVMAHREAAGRFTSQPGDCAATLLPLLHGGKSYGVFILKLPQELVEIPPVQYGIIEAFATQLAMLVAREELRETLAREQLYAESDRLRRTLLDSVSHELKTPIAVLRSAAEKLDTVDETKRQQLAQEIRTATARLERLVSNLLNQTRLESGALKPQLDWCDVRDLFAAAKRAAGSLLAGREFSIAIAEDMPLIKADAPLMEQVLGNLILNACLHTPANAAISLAAGIERERGKVYLRVEDRGPGIPAELRPQIFEKFLRGPTRAGGLGLGLSIARGFVQAQGGEILAENNPAGGARFTIYLPYVSCEDVPVDDR
jgi:two-component system sensor histidine kinase KdpD